MRVRLDSDSKPLQSKDFVEEEQIGLMLPNGKVVWPPNSYKGRPLATQEDRAVMLSVLKASAQELDFDEEEFLSQYGWATRHVVPEEVFAITDEKLTALPENGENHGE